MAGDWIKMRADLHEDPAVFAIARALQLERVTVVGYLHRFWGWADKHAVDGRVDGATSLVVDEAVEKAGFAAALEAVRWLESGPNFVVLPKHERHNGEPAKSRALKNQRQARWRDSRRSGDGRPSPHGDGVPPTPASTREEVNPKPSTRFARGTGVGVEGSSKAKSRKPSPVAKGSNGGTPPPGAGDATASTEASTPGAAIWEAYAPAYRERWGVEPGRTAVANSHCKRLAQLWPMAEAPDIIRWFLRSQRGLYVAAKHDLALAVRDAQALRTDWLRGEHGTEAQARTADRTAARGEAFRKIIDDPGGGHGQGSG